MKRIPLLLSMVLACSFLLGKDFWEKKPYSEWERKEAVKILMDSPWAQQQHFGQPQYGYDLREQSAAPPGSPVNAPARNAERRLGDHTVSRLYRVRFQSAKPVRMALAQMALLNEQVTREQAEQYIEQQPFEGKIVVAVSVAPGQDRTEFDRVTTELLKPNTYLLLKKSKRKIYIERYLSPAEANSTEAYMVFPRVEKEEPLITVREDEVRFISELGGDTKLNRKFKLKEMVFDGQLEI